MLANSNNIASFIFKDYFFSLTTGEFCFSYAFLDNDDKEIYKFTEKLSINFSGNQEKAKKFEILIFDTRYKLL